MWFHTLKQAFRGDVKLPVFQHKKVIKTRSMDGWKKLVHSNNGSLSESEHFCFTGFASDLFLSNLKLSTKSSLNADGLNWDNVMLDQIQFNYHVR